jgi:hypothetical protein
MSMLESLIRSQHLSSDVTQTIGQCAINNQERQDMLDQIVCQFKVVKRSTKKGSQNGRMTMRGIGLASLKC